MNNNQELKPCPFCSSDCIIVLDGFSEDCNWTVICNSCKSACGFVDTKDEAIKLWNTRSQEGLMEQMKALENAAIAYRKLTIVYRTGSRPSEKLFKELEEAKEALEKFAQWKNERGIK